MRFLNIRNIAQQANNMEHGALLLKSRANCSQHKNIMIKHFLKSLKKPQLTARFFEWMFFRVTVRFQRVTEF